MRGLSNTVVLKAFTWQMQVIRDVGTPKNPMESQRAALVIPHPRAASVLLKRGKGPASKYLDPRNTVDEMKLHESMLVNL